MKFKRTLQLGNVLLLALTIFLVSCTKEKKDAGTADASFRLITYNVWYGFTQVPERKGEWLTWMKDQAPDVVSLQELNEYTPEMLKSDAQVWGHPNSVLLKEEGFPTGITSKYPIDEVQKILKGFHHGLIRVRIKGMYFYVIHLHPSNWETRIREVNLILDDIKGLPAGSLVVLAGDFNTFSPVDSKFYTNTQLEPFFHKRDLDYQEKNLNEGKLDYSVIQTLMDAGYTDLEYAHRNDDYKFTGSFPTKIEKPGDHGENRRLDYVFVNGQLTSKATSASVIADEVTLILSDHLPVIVDFEF